MKPTPLLLTCLIGLAGPMAGLAQPTVQFSASSYTVAESAGAVTLTVQCTGDTNTEVGVAYATADGTATNGLKYTAVSGTLAFGANEPWLESHGYHHQVAPRLQSAARSGVGNEQASPACAAERSLAAGRQPWASWRNPVGIRRRRQTRNKALSRVNGQAKNLKIKPDEKRFSRNRAG